jgi:hypothetical protein
MYPRSPRRTLAVLALLSSLPLACGRDLIQLRPTQAFVPGPFDGLEVIASVAGGADPIPVRGSRLAYAGLTEATRRFIDSAAHPWAERHRPLRAGGWQLLVEITRSDAEVETGRLTVEIEARVTLRGTIGQVHLGQTHGYCKVADTLAGDGTPIVYTCLERLSRDLAGWLEGENP